MTTEEHNTNIITTYLKLKSGPNYNYMIHYTHYLNGNEEMIHKKHWDNIMVVEKAVRNKLLHASARTSRVIHNARPYLDELRAATIGMNLEQMHRAIVNAASFLKDIGKL